MSLACGEELFDVLLFKEVLRKIAQFQVQRGEFGFFFGASQSLEFALVKDCAVRYGEIC